MNILIPDSWLREYLITDAKPQDIQRCLSLCGPSIERTETVRGDVIYDIEVTTNRVDSYSVYGIARETAAILPEFGFNAKLLPMKTSPLKGKKKLDITIIDKQQFCKRILAVKIENIQLTKSPKWLTERLEKVGQRPLNNIIDITNYVMWETGHPIHAFDYDRLTKKKIIVREAKKGEHMITLDSKRHTLRGGELVFDDTTGTIIDLPGIMGTANTVVNEKTKNVLLFVENSDPSHIRFASMGLGIRTQAATINEKGPDPELAHITISRAATLACDIAKGSVASTLFDHYPNKPKLITVNLSHQKLVTYLGTEIAPKRVTGILTNLCFSVKSKNNTYEVTPPSWRTSDITIAEDIIEEVSRIYGYHNIQPHLPSGELPVVIPDPALHWEEEVKIRLRDWGYTELLTYSMISESQMDDFHLDKTLSYKISNPLSNDWVYMRPHLLPNVLAVARQNLKISNNLKLFELSMIYQYRHKNLPLEVPTLVVVWSGKKYFEAKGLAEALFDLFGIPFPDKLDSYGSITNEREITVLYLDFAKLISNAKTTKTYIPIPKYPPIIEDLAFIVPDRFEIGPLVSTLKTIHPFVHNVSLLDVHENTRTVHIEYLDRNKNLTDEEVRPIREKIIRLAEEKFGLTLKTP